MTDNLATRSPLGWLRERDIDLLMCSELHANEPLTHLIRLRLGCTGARFSGAWVSHADTHGETDLVVKFESAAGSHLALIENKIAADFQPDQAARYSLRRDLLLHQGGTSVRTILLAPAAYMTRSGADAFDDKISYEEVFDLLQSEADPRSKFLAGAIDSAIKQYISGYVPTPDALVSAMWEGLWSIGSRVAPNLNFAQPGLKPGRSTWICFTQATGFSKEDLRRVTIAFKAERGQVDLQFSRTTVQELTEKASTLLDAAMHIVPASKSASIRVNTPAIDFSQAVDDQAAAIVEGFAACERLRAFFVEHREQLLSDPT